MTGVSRKWFSRALSFGALLAVAVLAVSNAAAAGPKIRNQVIVPDEDRFTPFALTIRAGDFVKWTNNDTDDHTVVSDDVFNTAGNQGTNILIPGTDSNGGVPGTLILHFSHPGTFVYYCRFHAHLDDDNQPVAPGPRGGIQDANGNFGTPMSGIITVLPGGQD
jgi:plastocyanin